MSTDVLRHILVQYRSVVEVKGADGQFHVISHVESAVNKPAAQLLKKVTGALKTIGKGTVLDLVHSALQGVQHLNNVLVVVAVILYLAYLSLTDIVNRTIDVLETGERGVSVHPTVEDMEQVVDTAIETMNTNSKYNERLQRARTSNNERHRQLTTNVSPTQKTKEDLIADRLSRARLAAAERRSNETALSALVRRVDGPIDAGVVDMMEEATRVWQFFPHLVV